MLYPSPIGNIFVVAVLYSFIIWAFFYYLFAHRLFQALKIMDQRTKINLLYKMQTWREFEGILIGLVNVTTSLNILAKVKLSDITTQVFEACSKQHFILSKHLG